MEPSPLGDFFFAFLSVIFEGAPFIFLGTLVSGFIDAYLPSKFISRLLPRNVLGATMISGGLGLAFPVCECGIVPVIRRLVGKGLPVSAALTYMLSAPVISVIVFLSTWAAFKTPGGIISLRADGGDDALASLMTWSRFGMTYLIAVGAGLFIARKRIETILRPHIARTAIAARDRQDEPEPVREGNRLVAAFRTCLRDFLDTGMYFTIGVLITTIFNTQFDHARLVDIGQNDVIAVPGMMFLAFILSLCSTSDAFIVAPVRELSLASKLGFLVFGPMLDIKLLLMYLAVFRKKFVLILVITLFVVISLLSITWGQFFNL